MKQTMIQKNKIKNNIISSTDYKIVRGLINTILNSGVSLEIKSLLLTMIDVEFHKNGIGHISRRILSDFLKHLKFHNKYNE